MKYKKLKKLIQHPLRFHHQDIHEELDALKELVSSKNDLLCKILVELKLISSKLENNQSRIVYREKHDVEPESS